MFAKYQISFSNVKRNVKEFTIMFPNSCYFKNMVSKKLPTTLIKHTKKMQHSPYYIITLMN